METKYFSISSNESVSSKELGDLIVKEFGSNADGICITEIAKKASQQPAVPIQFVCCGESVCRVDDVNVDSLLKEGCTVEQIGAVLYVRGE